MPFSGRLPTGNSGTNFLFFSFRALAPGILLIGQIRIFMSNLLHDAEQAGNDQLVDGPLNPEPENRRRSERGA